jgi:hypothetical protein
VPDPRGDAVIGEKITLMGYEFQSGGECKRLLASFDINFRFARDPAGCDNLLPL